MPVEWRWRESEGGLIPVHTVLPSARDELLQVIRCISKLIALLRVIAQCEMLPRPWKLQRIGLCELRPADMRREIDANKDNRFERHNNQVTIIISHYLIFYITALTCV